MYYITIVTNNEVEGNVAFPEHQNKVFEVEENSSRFSEPKISKILRWYNESSKKRKNHDRVYL